MKKFEHLKLELKGMTVNERLGVCGLLDEWDKAVIAKDAKAMIHILMETFLTKEQAKETVNALLKNPEFYGY
ncbi:hypothetical protein [Kangiella sp. HZ709]|uniref:hypothetical protein n=1 Tax=Kangiella sp. HZ709 TaxID=2666328 RepID=UPI0012AEF415|nr:hypothetical protein [Kangiella sp. HZ709]MRX27083.1 hypothetical protein [Kangiella sp. HZ709]